MKTCKSKHQWFRTESIPKEIMCDSDSEISDYEVYSDCDCDDSATDDSHATVDNNSYFWMQSTAPARMRWR